MNVVCARVRAALAAWMVCACGGWAQSPAPAAQTPVSRHSNASLGDELAHMAGHEVHILFIHGIGSDGPHVHDSLALRKSICAYLKDCASPAGEQVGNYDYADHGAFAPGQPVPSLTYMGQPVWRTAEEWSAAAPFVVHYRLSRTGGPAVFVDELNWWPLVLSLKCRQIIASDARLTGPAPQRLSTCSTLEPDAAMPGRYISYDWIPPEEAQRLEALPRKGALANRSLKSNLADWGFADAIVSLGPLHSWLVAGLRQLILKSVAASPTASPENPIMPDPKHEFVLVSHSLGSYLIFSALNIDPADRSYAATERAREAYAQVLKQTSLVYFFANQVPLLELANLDEAPVTASETGQRVDNADEFVANLQAWGRLACDYQRTVTPGEACRRPKIVALNDPSDLLTWRVPEMEWVEVENISVQNAVHWFGLIEDPTKAHENYAKDKRAIRQMLRPTAE